MAVRKAVAALKCRFTRTFYQVAHVAGGRFHHSGSFAHGHPETFRFSHVLPAPVPRTVDALWRRGVLRTLIVASTLQHQDDLSGCGHSQNSVSVSTRFQPIPHISRAAFLGRFQHLSAADQNAIRLAYDLGLAAHSQQTREIGGAYFAHPKAVALILADECAIQEARLIVAALLHDVLEDTTLLGRDLGEARLILTQLFGRQTAETVISLTKQTVLEKAMMKDTSKEGRAHRLSRYTQQLAEAPIGTVLVKIADRLHNAQSIARMDSVRRKRFVAETRNIFLPLFNQTENYYADYPEYLVAARYLLERLTVTLDEIAALG